MNKDPWISQIDIKKLLKSKLSLVSIERVYSSRNLEKINKKKVYFNGNIKLVDRIDEKNIKNINENLLSNKRFWFAASTHKEENVFCLRTHQKIKKP